MTRSILIVLLTLSSSVFANTTPPSPAPFTGKDYSGAYDCTGQDFKEGPYTGIVTMALNKAHSVGAYGAYSFTLEVPGYGTYKGQAVSMGNKLGIHFGLDDPTTQDYGTGIATVSQRKGKTVFQKFYYEPAFKGGNHGTEYCTRR